VSPGRPDIVEIYLRLPPEDIAYVKYVIESYEGVAVLRTVDRTAAIVVVMIAADLEHDARGILQALQHEVAWTEVPPPRDG